MSVLQGNKLIAEFMGWEHHSDPEYDAHEMKNLKYHSSWDQLMPVVEKIAKMKFKYDNADEWYSPYPTTFGMVDDEGNYMVRIYSSQLFSAPTLIEAAWNVVVDFIEWYSIQTQVKK